MARLLRTRCRFGRGLALPRAFGRLLTGMPKYILPKTRTLIPSSFVVRALAHEGPRFHCCNCGDVMFVRGATGLCPMCFNDRKPNRSAGKAARVREVPHEMVLAGVLDDPMLDGIEGQGGPDPGAV